MDIFPYSLLCSLATAVEEQNASPHPLLCSLATAAKEQNASPHPLHPPTYIHMNKLLFITSVLSCIRTGFPFVIAVSFMGISALSGQTTRHNLSTTTGFQLDGAAGTYNIPTSTYTGSNNQQISGTVIEDAIFIPYNTGSGSGTYRRLFQMNGKDVVDGYNRDAGDSTFEASTPNGFNELLKVGELVANNGYYQFSLDINEPGSNPNKFLSVDRLRLYVESAAPYTTDPNPLPKTVTNLTQLGTLVYDMDATADNSILLDYSLAGGSGSDDMTFLIPISRFSGFNANAYVYLYAEHGAQGTFLDGFENNAGGFDEWAVLDVSDKTTRPPVQYMRPIPEPSALMLFGVGIMAMLRRRRN